MKSKITESFIQLVKISLDLAPPDSLEYLTMEEWNHLYAIVRQQAIIGVTSLGVLKLTGENKPYRKLRFNWLYTTEEIIRLNKHINQVSIKMEESFFKDGFPTSVLKGQGVSNLYPRQELRQAGDIDLWVSGRRKKIIDYVTSKSRSTHSIYHHIDGLVVDDVNVELHFMPSYLISPFADRKLQAWFKNISSEQFSHTVTTEYGTVIHTPDTSFNRVFILLHIFRHFLHEGIGLRQMMDFYYVLLQGFTEKEREETVALYKKFNLMKFAGATTYVMAELFDLKGEFQIVKPNEKYGRILLNEILSGGNFGNSFRRSGRFNVDIIYRGWKRLLRGLRFVQMCPQEVLWMPYFKIVNRLLYVRTYRGDENISLEK